VVILVCCCAFGGLAYLLDSGVARTTLYEIDAEGSAAEVPASIEFDVAVEHPGARHDLLVAPKRESDVDSPAPVRGAAARSRRSAAARGVEDARAALRGHPRGVHLGQLQRAEFTPVAPGVHRLIVTLDTPDVPVLHVRIGDEQKTDGVRAPGY
jgi:hypothetical protein